MNDLSQRLTDKLKKHETLTAEVARLETSIRADEREYWTERGFSVLPRRERLKAALAEDARALTPLEIWLESTAK